MSQLTDELLDELSDLEQASQDLTQPTARSTGPNTAQSIDAASMALEAAKASQEAAEESHKAIEAAIKMSHEQKAQAVELSESNLSWRQTLRTANNQLHDTKNTTAMLMAFTIFISLVATGIMGWFAYSMQQKFDLFKGEVLDLVRTENLMFNKQITLKVDQLSSLLELLASDIQYLMRNTQNPTQAAIPPSTTEPTQSLINLSHEADRQAVQSEPQTPQASNAETTTEHTNHVGHANAYAYSELTESKLMTMEHKIEQLASLLQKISQTQEQLHASTLHALQTQSKTATPSATAAALTPEQEKKLNGISWLVRQQHKAIETIQAQLKANQQNNSNKHAFTQLHSTLANISQQITALKSQQREIELQVIHLKEETGKLSQEFNKDKQIYRYYSP